jgi:4-methylaminobutanoate oxidase (formaldehyde-forming)
MMPARAQVVIIGGGIIGASVAYHLTALGWRDVVLLEQGQLSCGTTWHAAGLVGQLRATESGTRLVQYSASLYSELEAETGLATGFKRCGGVTVARTEDRMIQLQRTAATAEAFDLECELLSPAQAEDRYPLLETADLLGAIWLPGDGTANPVDVTASLARGARARGATILEHTRVLDVLTDEGRVTGVVTEDGAIEAEIVVNCAGQWAKAIGAMAGVNVPLHSAEHFYVVTEQIDGVTRDLPILRDPDGYTYFKEEVGGLVVGGFEPEAKPWVSPDALPYPFEFQLLDEDWEHFSVLMDSALGRLPVLHEVGIKQFYNGPESFTPDNQFIIGEAPEVAGFFVGAGFNSVGIASAGGAGRALAEWIVEGEPTSDLVAMDIRRFGSFHANNQWLRARVGEVLGLHYAIPWPNRELTTARPFRRSPVHHLLAERGAQFGSKFGWERPNVFAPKGVAPELDYTWAKPAWLSWSMEEQLGTREGVALFDETSFGKLLVAGRDAEAVLQRLCTQDVAVEMGRTVYTGMLNSRGGYEADVTLTRLDRQRYLLVTSAASPVRDASWIERHTAASEHVLVTDVSSAYAVFGVMGPKARQLLGRLSRAELSAEAFAFGSSREIDLGAATVRATRLTYVGELGWELYVPTELACGVFEDLSEVGQELGAVNAGYSTINSLRLDKGYRAFGSDLTPEHNPVEAGLRFTCKLKSSHEFLGRSAVEEAMTNGVRRRLVSLRLSDPEVMLWGGELVLRDGVAVGQVTSAAWSATLESAVALAYVWREDHGVLSPQDLSTGSFAVNAGGVLSEATLSLRALYDPEHTKIHS